MALYAKQDYAGAASALRAVTDAQPAFVAARFYLGISLLLSGDRIAGIQELRALTTAGDGPYLERGAVLSGQRTDRRARRAIAPRSNCEDLIAQHGDLEKQAAVLLAQIRPVGRSKP